MATWTTRTRTRREWVVPLRDGCCDHVQLITAIHSAQSACATALHKDLGDLTDDVLKVGADGDEIVIWFETHELGPAR